MELKKDEVLILVKVNSDLVSSRGFKYPENGFVKDSAWEETEGTYKGIYGLLWGSGKDVDPESTALVLKTDTYARVQGSAYVCCPAAEVVFKGNVRAASALIEKYAPDNVTVNYLTQITDKEILQNAGQYAYQLAGNGVRQNAECCSIQIAEKNAEQNSEAYSLQIAAMGAVQKAAEDVCQIAGDNAKQRGQWTACQIAGTHAFQKAGDESVQMASNRSIQIAGYKSIQIAGDNSIQKADVGTLQVIKYWVGMTCKTKARRTTRNTAGKFYKFYEGDWHEIKESDMEELWKNL